MKQADLFEFFRHLAEGNPASETDLEFGNRSGLAKGKTMLAAEIELERKVPQPFRFSAHHSLILRGRCVCRAHRQIGRYSIGEVQGL